MGYPNVSEPPFLFDSLSLVSKNLVFLLIYFYSSVLSSGLLVHKKLLIIKI